MDKQREMFEAWWSDYSKNHHITGEPDANVAAENAWQAAIATVKQQVPLSMRDPLSQASLVVQEWNEGAADQEEWGNEACQAIFALSNCINTLLIEAGTKTQAAIAAQQAVQNDLIIALRQARYVLRDLHAKQPDCGLDKLAAACEIAADLMHTVPEPTK